ncbi:unnamed protein product [Rotaria sp. Silwood1]|nr:unnamed protein product [Rotaria sp. Silwood1]CAF4565427.1 unnamed protein product [Rotaria sp. Silwood1]
MEKNFVLKVHHHSLTKSNKCDFKPLLRRGHFNENADAYKIASILYGLVVFIGGVAFSISRAIIPREQGENIKDLAAVLKIKIYFTYLYWLSIIWIIFCIADIVGHKRQSNIYSSKINSLDSNHIQMNMFRKNRNFKYSSTFSINEETNHFQDNHKRSKSLDNSSIFMGKSINILMKRQTIDHTQRNNIHHRKYPSVQRIIGYNYDDYSTAGGLYIRVGIGIFCLGTVIHSGLSILSYLEHLPCTPWTAVMDDFSRLLFSFVQFFFIFKHSNLVIRAHENFARLAVMHVVVTNLCVWFRMIVSETKFQILEMHAYEIAKEHHNNVSINNNNLIKIRQSLMNRYHCTQSTDDTLPMTAFINEGYIKLKPLLYPCTIEFSLMCLTLFFIIWENIGKTFTHKMSNKASSKNVFMVNCHASIKGLFVGMIIFSCTVISIILYAILQNKISDDRNSISSSFNIVHTTTISYQNYSLLTLSTHSPFTSISKTPKKILYSIAIVEIVNLCLLIISLFATIWALIKIRKLQYRRITTRFDNVLIIVSLAGIYLYSIFSAFALLINKNSVTWIAYVKIIIVILEFIEGTIHAFFILIALRKRLIRNSKHEYPAREVMTLLIILDLSLWFEETTTTTKHEANPFQLAFYHIVPWSIIAAIATPLQIFFRFHASVCLSHVWENMYTLQSYEPIAPHGL